jgi:hypothetical protein
MNLEHQIIAWIEEDKMRVEALRVAASFNLSDWCIAAGFIRNLVWDKLHNYSSSTPLNDINLIYFDSANLDKENDISIEDALCKKFSLSWSVNNQVRMHIRNDDKPYSSTSHAMSY